MASGSTEKTESNRPSIGLAGRIRFALRALGIIVSLLACIPFHYLWRMFRLRSPWPRYFLYATAWCCGAIIKTDGKRLKKDVFYVSNHLSWVDIPIVAGGTGCSFIAQDGISKWPVIGWLCRLNNTVFVSRESRLSVSGQIGILREAIDQHQPVTIFPEGTTTDGQELLPFKPSLFEVLAPPPKPMLVQPLLLDYGDAAADIAWIGEETAPANAWRLLTRKGALKARLVFLEPFDPSVFPDRKSVATEARKRIAEALSASLGGKPIV